MHTLIGAYALDALDDLERAGFERHLAACGRAATRSPGCAAPPSASRTPPPCRRRRACGSRCWRRSRSPRRSVTPSPRPARSPAAGPRAAGVARGAAVLAPSPSAPGRRHGTSTRRRSGPGRRPAHHRRADRPRRAAGAGAASPAAGRRPWSSPATAPCSPAAACPPSPPTAPTSCGCIRDKQITSAGLGPAGSGRRRHLVPPRRRGEPGDLVAVSVEPAGGSASPRPRRSWRSV